MNAGRLMNAASMGVVSSSLVDWKSSLRKTNSLFHQADR